MKLWLISQNVNNNWDTYDSAVVAAETEEEARLIHPSFLETTPKEWGWCKPEYVKVEYLGTTEREISGVICASFNAG